MCTYYFYLFIYLSKRGQLTQAKDILYLCTLVLFVVEEGILFYQRLDKVTPAALKKEH